MKKKSLTNGNKKTTLGIGGVGVKDESIICFTLPYMFIFVPYLTDKSTIAFIQLIEKCIVNHVKTQQLSATDGTSVFSQLFTGKIVRFWWP